MPSARPRISYFAIFLLFTAMPLLSGCGTGRVIPQSEATQGPPGPPGLIFTNQYNPTTPYVLTDVVTFAGSSYVAVARSTGIPPIGDPASTATWAVLAQQGAIGPQGLQGTTGPIGPIGPQGLTGPAGARGVSGSQGIAGTTGPSGPSGPAGPVGATGPAGQSPAFPLASRHFSVQGDSITFYTHAWQDVVTARTGMAEVAQNARPGRGFSQAFEEYGTTTPGYCRCSVNQGITSTPTGNYSTGTPGNTLAQDIAAVDLLIIELGTNDQSVPLGALGDAQGAGTFFGDMRWVVETYLAAKPTLRIVLVTPQLNGFASAQTTQTYVNAEIAYANSMALPVINMFLLGGLNPLTSTTLTVDGTHPNAYDYTNFYGPVIAQHLQLYF